MADERMRRCSTFHLVRELRMKTMVRLTQELLLRRIRGALLTRVEHRSAEVCALNNK